MAAEYTIYSENGCLLCREAEGTLRLLLGDQTFNRHFKVAKMTFQPELMQAFQSVSGSATIPKLYQGDFRTGHMMAASFDDIMAQIATGELLERVGQQGTHFPTDEQADALVIGAGPGGLAAYKKLADIGLNPLVVTETVGGKLTAMAGGEGVLKFRQLTQDAKGWWHSLRPGIEIEDIRLEGNLKIITAGPRTYRTQGPLVLATGISVQHFDLQVELDFLDKGLGYHTRWNEVRNCRATVYALRGQGDLAYQSAQQLSKQNNDVTLITPSPLSDDQRRVLETLFLVHVIEGRVDQVVQEGTPPKIVAVKTGGQLIPTDWLLWNQPFRSRAKSLYKATLGTDWLHVDERGRVLDNNGKVVPGVFGVGDAVEGNPKTLEDAIASAENLKT